MPDAPGTESLLPARSLLHYQRPESMSDGLRGIWFRIHRSHAYEPSNVEARFVCQRLRDTENERNHFEGALRFILTAAESWHGDDAAKARALAVIAAVCKEALPDE